jgi:hypothetical protein
MKSLQGILTLSYTYLHITVKARARARVCVCVCVNGASRLNRQRFYFVVRRRFLPNLGQDFNVPD